MPRLARQVTRAWFERLLKGKNRNKRSDHLATRQTAYYILFSAKTRIQINKTHTQSRTENSLFQSRGNEKLLLSQRFTHRYFHSLQITVYLTLFVIVFKKVLKTVSLLWFYC